MAQKPGLPKAILDTPIIMKFGTGNEWQFGLHADFLRYYKENMETLWRVIHFMEILWQN